VVSVTPRRSSPGIVRRAPFGSNPRVGERGSDTQRRILEGALAVFGEVGFSEARVELIADAAGCSRPAFYQYFSSKDDVFWVLATELGREMVALAERLEPVTPDAHGLRHLTAWIGSFMDLHEAWAPVFDSFQIASRDHERRRRGSSGISDRTGSALLRAFGVEGDERQATVVTGLVAALIRCSFFAEHTVSTTERAAIVESFAALLHRVFHGPLEGVNLDRTKTAVRVPPDPDPPATSDPPRPMRKRGERTRQRLLDAGATVLPRRGYRDTRVDDLVAIAEVSHGTFYRYFENKDDFFRVLAETASGRMLDHLAGLRLDAGPTDLRAWLRSWFDTYEADGGVVSAWQEMQSNAELADFSRRVAASVHAQLRRILQARDFGDPATDAIVLLALIERVPYSVYTLRFRSADEAIESMVTILRRGFAGLPG
jgi:AcrR family transcriptional regulator